MTTRSAPPRLTVLLSFSGQGGVERMVLNLLHGFVEREIAVDLLALRADAAQRREVPPEVRIVPMGVRHSALALPGLIRYLRRERPRALLAAKDRAIRVAALARRLAGVDTRLVGRLGTNLSAALVGQSRWRRWLRYQPMRWVYPLVDRVVAVSEGVAADTLAITGLPPERVAVIRNPVITPRLPILASAPLGHPWFDGTGPAVILGAGRLTRQKDFTTLIRAFATLRRYCRARLVILGEGRQRAELEQLATRLGVRDDVDLPGFVDNPYPFMARAALFVLSSAWEGSPNVLTEALALGTPVVATDCPSGPREILDGGRHGPLVPVGVPEKMAEAMIATLAHPPPRAALRDAVRDYTLARSARAYLRVLGLDPASRD